MNRYPPRPTVTREIIMQAAVVAAAAIGCSPADAQDIADAYKRCGPDGFDIAKELGRNGWDMSAADVVILDDMQLEIGYAVRELERNWAQENNIQPPLAIGTEIKEGVITGVSDYLTAHYSVKGRGCAREGRWLLIRFEDASLPEPPK